MTATPEQQAPGCFGAVSCYAMDSTICQDCVAYAACGAQVVVNLEQLRGLVDVSDLVKRHQAARQKMDNKLTPPTSAPLAARLPLAQPESVTQPMARTTSVLKVVFEVGSADQATLDTLGAKSVKAKEAATVLCKNNRINDLRVQLPKGINPFDEKGPQYLRIACDLLLSGGFTKAQYKNRLMAELGWTDGTAASHVAVACAILYSFGIATLDSSGALILNPQLTPDNDNQPEGSIKQ